MPDVARRCRLVLEIAGVPYSVRAVPRGELVDGVSQAWRLTRTDRKGRKFTYTVSAGRGPTTCSCPDSTFHASGRAECKHLAAARACGLI